MDLWGIIVLLATIIHNIYVYSFALIVWFPNKHRAKFCLSETRPFFMPSCTIMLFNDFLIVDSWWFSVVLYILDYIIYRYSKDFYDDRWKKRRKKVTEKIKAMNGKLVVVPNNA